MRTSIFFYLTILTACGDSAPKDSDTADEVTSESDDGGAGAGGSGDGGSGDGGIDGDVDNDGFTEAQGDCDDTNANVNPDAEEDCATQYDDDCNGNTNDEDARGCMMWFPDIDEDGYGGEDALCLCVATETHRTENDDDCDDSDPTIHPGIEEDTCDGVNNDCDEEVDEDGWTAWYPDADGDGHGFDGTSVMDDIDDPVVMACEAPEGESDHVYVDVGGDCNDDNDSIHPDAIEVCDDLDNDCNDLVDDECTTGPF